MAENLIEPLSSGRLDTKPDLISVIMPCYNSAAHLPSAIESVLQQEYPSVELLLVDDGSDDGRTWAICKEAARKAPVRVTALQQDNQGPYPARNLGLARASGAYVAFLDSDDYWDTGALRELHEALERGGADIAYCGWQNVGRSKSESRPYVPPNYASDDVVLRFLKGCPWPIHAALVRRRTVEKIGGFSTRCFSAMDFDFWLRLSSVTRRMVRVNKVLAYYRWHDDGQISSVRWRQVLDAWRVRSDFIANHPELVKHIPHEELRGLLGQAVLGEAYRAFWRRDLTSAHRLFRAAFMKRYCGLKDMKYVAPTLLPHALYHPLMSAVLRNRDSRSS